MSAASRIREDVRQMGVGGWFVYALGTFVARSTFGRMRLLALRFYVQPVARQRLLPARRSSDPIQVNAISRETFHADDFARPAEVIRDRFDDGSVCLAAVKGGELLGYMWLQPGVLRERLVRCRMHALPAGRVAWDYDFHIEPQYRLGRLFARLWDRAFEVLRDREIEATVSWIRLENRGSEQAHLRLGARRMGWALFVTIFEHQFMLSSMRPLYAYTPPGRTADLYVDAARLLAPRSSLGTRERADAAPLET